MWADRLERRLGFLAMPGLAAFLAGMNGAVGLLSIARPDFVFQLVLDPDLVRQGQVWRLLTFIVVPPEVGVLWLVLWLILFYGFLQLLETSWGDFKMTLYCVLGAAAHGVAALAGNREMGNSWFNASLFLAFARLHPDLEVRLFFFIPVRMKWMAAFTGLMAAAALLFGASADRLAVGAGLANYFLYFGGEHWKSLRRALRRP